ncbi:phosphatase PAP2 family protein [Sporosarcina sp. 179-K 3D1 HS]|uniref:phosphatase PAP2 family protein n=1 Tax=Sporosarcina sp. 179-K 3D1 HS TaxID=3232169 RepID=UPI00399F6DF0
MRDFSTRFIWAFVSCILLGGLFAYLATAISYNAISHFDNPIIAAIQGMEQPWLTTWAKLLEKIGSGSVVMPITIILSVFLGFLKRRETAILILTAVIGSGALNRILKMIFVRERPTIHRLSDIGGYSFPSGHAMLAMSLYGVLAYVLWRSIKTSAGRVLLLLVAVFMILVIGASRIYLGVHYPSDVLGGLSISAIWLILCASVYGAFQRKKAESGQQRGRNPS